MHRDETITVYNHDTLSQEGYSGRNHPFTERIQWQEPPVHRKDTVAGTTRSQEGYSGRNHPFTGRIQSLGNHPFTGRIQSQEPPVHRKDTIARTTRSQEGYRNHPFTRKRKAEATSLSLHHLVHRDEKIAGTTPFTG